MNYIRERNTNRFQETFSRFVGRGGIPFEEVEELSGIPVGTLRLYANGHSKPGGFDQTYKILGAMPASFTSQLLAPLGMTVSSVDEDALDDSEMLARLTEAAACKARALADGHIDHRERETLKAELHELQIQIAAYLTRWAN